MIGPNVTARLLISGPKFQGGLDLSGFMSHETAREVCGVFIQAFEEKYPGHLVEVIRVVQDLRLGLRSESTEPVKNEKIRDENW